METVVSGSQFGVMTRGGSRVCNIPEAQSEPPVAAKTSHAFEYMSAILDDSIAQSCSSSWIMHKESIQRYLRSRACAIVIASRKVCGSSVTTTCPFRVSTLLLVVFDCSELPQQYDSATYCTGSVSETSLTWVFVLDASIINRVGTKARAVLPEPLWTEHLVCSESHVWIHFLSFAIAAGDIGLQATLWGW
jgi:hypothetical protein